MEVKNAIITGTNIGFDHGMLTAWIYLQYDTSSQAFGGYNLCFRDTPNGPYAAIFIARVLMVVGVEDWNDLPGKTLRVECDHEKIYKIMNIISDNKSFTPEEEFKSIKS